MGGGRVDGHAGRGVRDRGARVSVSRRRGGGGRGVFRTTRRAVGDASMRAIRRGAHAGGGRTGRRRRGGGEGGGGEGEAAKGRRRRRRRGGRRSGRSSRRARARFSATIHLPATRTVGNVSPRAVSPDPDFRRVAVFRLGAASSAASRALEEAARAVVDAGRLAEVLVGEMHAGTNLRFDARRRGRGDSGRRSSSSAPTGASPRRRARPRGHLGESRETRRSRVAAVTVRAAAGADPDPRRDSETRRTDAAGPSRGRTRGLSGVGGDDASEIRARPGRRRPDRRVLADALARVERFAEDEDEGTRMKMRD